MKIQSLELAWFRGAADPITLELNCKSMVVYGANGSGKSSFVDAIECILNRGRIAHLRHEYSSSNQANGILNTHKPDDRQTAINVTLADKSVVQRSFLASGASASTGQQGNPVAEWQYRQTVLRQDEVSAFIHNTKGEKYSALLPLFGLQGMELTAENLRQLTKAIRSESKYEQKQTTLRQMDGLRREALGSLSDDAIIRIIKALFLQYCPDDTVSSDLKSNCDQIEAAIDTKIGEYSVESQKYFCLQQLANSPLKERINAVRDASVGIAASTEPYITKKLEVLQSAGRFGDALEGVRDIECPACGQSISTEAFREHVKSESKRLKQLNDLFLTYRADIGLVCTALSNMKSDSERDELCVWREETKSDLGAAYFRYLDELNVATLRDTCSEKHLKAIEQSLLPIIDAAGLDSREAPQAVQSITNDKSRVAAAKSVVSSKSLEKEINDIEDLISYLVTLEEKVRHQIRSHSQNVIDGISGDIEGMWETLHPEARIDNVHLSVPQEVDKAIDVVLSFHGLSQDSPRLTLSEGYRNSLGLCIFLAMAKQVACEDRPLFLDDVVISLDRNHRGMIHKVIEDEFADRQVVIFTHDGDWYRELRHQLGDKNTWAFKALLPYDSPEIGIRFSDSPTEFDVARGQLQERPDSAGNDARKIMDAELPSIAERLKIRLPYLRSDRNDRRTAHEILTYLGIL